MAKVRTIKEVQARVELEDLCYAIQHYYGKYLNSEDEVLDELWTDAYTALHDLEQYLQEAE